MTGALSVIPVEPQHLTGVEPQPSCALSLKDTATFNLFCRDASTDALKHYHSVFRFCLIDLYFPVNIFSVMSGHSYHFMRINHYYGEYGASSRTKSSTGRGGGGGGVETQDTA